MARGGLRVAVAAAMGVCWMQATVACICLCCTTSGAFVSLSFRMTLRRSHINSPSPRPIRDAWCGPAFPRPHAAPLCLRCVSDDGVQPCCLPDFSSPTGCSDSGRCVGRCKVRDGKTWGKCEARAGSLFGRCKPRNVPRSERSSGRVPPSWPVGICWGFADVIFPLRQSSAWRPVHPL